MSCDVVEATENLDNEVCYDYIYELCSFSNLSVTSPTSQLILQPFPRFTYITAHSITLPLLHLRHSSFSNPFFASPKSQDFTYVTWRAAHAHECLSSDLQKYVKSQGKNLGCTEDIEVFPS